MIDKIGGVNIVEIFFLSKNIFFIVILLHARFSF